MRWLVSLTAIRFKDAQQKGVAIRSTGTQGKQPCGPHRRRDGDRVPAPPAARVRLVAVIALVLSIGAWRGAAAAEHDDPFEPFNRAVFQFNRVVDGLVLKPASELYGLIVPRPAKTAISNLLDTLRAPIVFLNDILQGERERAGITLSRFLINGSLGFFGLFDMASEFGYLKHDEDFGQTLAVHGVGEGPYLMLPILGPSNPRDAVGLVVDSFLFDPMRYVAPTRVRTTRTVSAAVVTRYELGPSLDELERSSIDFYAALRSVYRQKREAEIRNGRPPADSGYEEIFNETFDDPAPDRAPAEKN